MEEFFQAIGMIGVIFLVLVGLVAGWIASRAAGGRRTLPYMVIGVLAALAIPFILAAIGVGILAAGGLLAVIAAAAVGAIVVLLIAKMIFD